MTKRAGSIIKLLLSIVLLLSDVFGAYAACPGALTFVNSVNSASQPASLSYSPDSQFLTAGFLAADKVTTYVVDQTTGALSGGVDTLGDRANYVQYSPNGKFFATVSLALNRLAIYSVDQLGNLTFITHFGGSPQTNGSNFLSFSPDSKFVSVSNQNSGLITVYSINQTSGVPTFVGNFGGSPILNNPVSLDYSPNGKFLTVVYQNSNTIRMFSVNGTTGVLTQVAGSDTATHAQPAFVRFSPDSRFVAVANEGSNRLDVYSVNQATGLLTPVQSPSGLNTASSLAYAPTGEFAAITSDTVATARVFSVNANTGIFTFLQDISTDSISESIVYAPNGKFAALANETASTIAAYVTESTFDATLNVSSTTICSGDSTNLVTTITGGTAPYTVSFSDGFIKTGSSPLIRTVSPTTTTTYTINSITDANGCIVTNLPAPITIAVNASPSSAMFTASSTVICSGDSTTLTTTITGGTAPYTVMFSDGFSQTGSSPLARLVVPTVTTTYTINSITDSNGCSLAVLPASVTVTVNQSPNSAALRAQPDTICSGGSSLLITTISGGTAPYTVMFSDGFSQTGNSPLTRTVSPTTTTMYTINSITDANGCSPTSLPGSVTVTVAQSPASATLGASPDTICSGGSSTLTTTITGGTAPYTVDYFDGFSQTGNSPLTRTVSPTTTTTYTINSITDANGCSLATLPPSVTVTVGSLVQAVLGASQTSICLGDLVTLTLTITGDGPFDVTWSDGVVQTNVSSPVVRTVSPTINTKYSASVKNSEGCTVGSNGVGIVVTPLAQPISVKTVCGRAVIFTPPICGTATLVSVGQPQHGIAVIIGNQIAYTPTAGFSGSDIFGYTAQDGQGNTGSARIGVSVAPTAFLTTVTVACDTPLTFTPDICGSNIISLTVASQPSHGTATSNGATTLTYTPNSGYSGADQFAYTIRDNAGGVSTAQVTVSVCPVPGVITPVGTFSSLAAPSALDFNPINTRIAPIQRDRLAVITDELANKVQLYNIDTHDFSLSDTEDGPSGVKFFPTEKYVAVINARSNSLTMYRLERLPAEPDQAADVAAPRLRRRARLVKLKSYATLKVPQAIAISRRDRLAHTDDANAQAISPTFAAVANADSNAVTVFKLDETTGDLAKIGDFPTQRKPVALAYSPNGGTLAVANADSNSLSLFRADLSTGELSRLGEIKTGRNPVSVDYSPDGQFVAVANKQAQTVQVFTTIGQDSGRLAKIQDLSIKGQPLAVRYSPDSRFAAISVAVGLAQGDELNTPENLLLARSRIETYKILRRRLAKGAELEQAQLLPDGTLEFLSEQPTGLDPRALEFTPDNSLLATGNHDSNSISVFNTNAAAFAAQTILAIPCCDAVAFTVNAYGEGVKIVAVGQAEHGTVSFAGLQVVYTPNANFHGTDSFSYTVTDDLGNRSSSFVQITVGGAFSVTLTATPPRVCAQGVSILNLVITEGTAPFTITWSDGVIQESASGHITREVSPQITTTYSALIKQGDGQVVSSPEVVVAVSGQAPTVTVSASQRVIELGQQVTLTAIAQGVAPFTFVWSDGLVQTSDAKTVTRVVRPKTTTTYSVTVTDEAGCVSAPARITINVGLTPESAIVRAIRNKYC